MQIFRSEITLKNKISYLKSDLRNPLLNYNKVAVTLFLKHSKCGLISKLL